MKKYIGMTLIFIGIVVGLVPFSQTVMGNYQQNKMIREFEKSVRQKKKIKNGCIGMIEIPAIELKYAIKEGTASKVLNEAVGHVGGSAGLGQKGNCILAAHRGGRQGNYFLYLNQLKKGQLVRITDAKGRIYRYQVEKVYVSGASDSRVLDSDKRIQTLTLITCENRGKQRIIVKCMKL